MRRFARFRGLEVTLPAAYSIDKPMFRALAAEHASRSEEPEGGPLTYTPIFRRIPADLDTPVSALLKTRRGDYCFLLESVERGNQVGRYSFLGSEPRRLLTAKDGLVAPFGRGDQGSGIRDRLVGSVASLRDPHTRKRVPAIPGPRQMSRAAGADPLAELDRLISSRRLVTAGGEAIPPFCGGAVGYVGYEIASSLEPVHVVGNDPLRVPDLAFALYDTLVV